MLAATLVVITLALIMLILLAPVFLATALAVKLDSKGSVFFKQKRFGFNNQMVDVYKFRSLRSDHADFAAAKSFASRAWTSFRSCSTC